ncbi:rod shape-determining protein MreC [Thioalkalivibrio denitrificans]|uniref:Cell shape-determining protein MreC n=1 Tax=Thioalkalivibrio denitrificans TaxID=108003 RepID=A0A1V3NCV1_9GAMM|nr:rod shape-determining protein MreC [Thioalkalivibrio denitrificans]OOG22929.1 rod shape-determining protein MreC [Thioalkalivibrio denitrificans]
MGPSPAARLALLALLSIGLMWADHRHQHVENLRAALALVIYPVQVAVDVPVQATAWLSEQVSTHQQLVAENRRLREEQFRLNALMLRFEALEEENTRLRQLLDTSTRLRDPLMIAEIMSVDLDPFRQQIIINRGRMHGAYPGQPLINAQGVVGQVLESHPLHSVVLLISDPSHALPVLVNRTGLRTLAVGTGSPDRLELRHIPPAEDVEPGDIISTSGLGGRFPADYPVAEITRVERIPGEAFAHVEARPLARLDRSREVLLLTPAAQPDAPEIVVPTDHLTEPEEVLP